MNPEVDIEKIHQAVEEVIPLTGVVMAHQVLAELDVSQSQAAEPLLPHTPGQSKVALSIIDQLESDSRVEVADSKALTREMIIKAAARRRAARRRRQLRVPLIRFSPTPLPDYLQEPLHDPHDDPYDD